MKFAVLGPLEVLRGSAAVSIGSPKERRLLAALALNHGRVVSVDYLIDAVWDGAAPTSAAKTLQGYVVHLRHALGSEGESLISTVAPGYRLDITDDDLDSARFESLIAAARTALGRSDAATALEHFEEALALWRADPYYEFLDSPIFTAERERLVSLHRYAIEARIAAHLDLGAGPEIVPELESLTRRYPLSEELWAQLMVAQFRSGRQAEALASYTRASKLLADELGVDPGPHLRDVQLAVLTHDPRLIGPYTSANDRASDHEPPFAGREGDLYTLRSSWLEASRGHGRVVVVSAPSGFGKSRLIEQFAREVRAAGGNVARARRARTPDPAELIERMGAPLLIVIDEPMTAISADVVRDLPTMIVIGVDPETTPMHVLSGLVGADLITLQPLNQIALERIAEWASNGQLPRTVITDIAATVDGNPATAIAEARAAVAAQNNAARVLAVADTSTARNELDSARERLTQSLLLSRSRNQAAGTTDRQPWLGLATYTADDQALFHGRDQLVADVLARLAELNRVTLVGPSGSGKSSAIAAGVVPALANGALPTSQIWQQHVVRAGEPIERLGREHLVIVDQAEELWTTLHATERNEFLGSLESARLRGAAIILALRGDFLDLCSSDPRLADIVRDSIVLVPSLTDDEVRSVVTEPARLFGAEVDPIVVDRIVHEMRHEPAALPLVSTALAQAWQRHSGSRISERDYQAAGGIAGALNQLAERTYENLDPAAQHAARAILLRLTTTSTEGVVTRRRLSPDELDDSVANTDALRDLSQSRLITIDAHGIELTHEALLTHWPRLAGWLREDDEFRQIRSDVTQRALAWDAAGRADGDLLQGARLAAAIDWSAARADEVSALEGDYIAASTTGAQRELETERARAAHERTLRRRMRTALVVMSLVLVLALVAGVMAWQQRQSAVSAQRAAVARQLVEQSTSSSSLEKSLQLAVAAYRLSPDAVTTAALTNVLVSSAGLVHVLYPGTKPLLAIAVTSNGKAFLTAGKGPNLYSFNTATFVRQHEQPVAGAGITALAARPGHNDQVAVGGVLDQNSQTPVTAIWDERKAQQTSLSGVTAPIASFAWTTDGTWIVGAQDTGAVLAWSAAHPSAAPVVIPGNSARFRRVVAIGPSRVIVFESNEVATVWDLPATGATSATKATTFAAGPNITAVAASPDGKYFAVGHGDGSVTIWDATSLSPIATNTSDTSMPSALVFTVDGHRVIVGHVDGSLSYLATLDGTVLSRSRGHDGQVTSLAVGPGGQRLYSVGADGAVMVWRTDGATGITSVLKPALPVGYVADGLLVSGTRLAETSPSGILAAFDSRDPANVETMPYDASNIVDTRLANGGRDALQSFANGFAQLTTIASGNVVKTYPVAAHQPVTMAAMSPDGTRVALTTNGPSTVHIVDARTGADLLPAISVMPGAGTVEWSPDGQRVAVGSWAVPQVAVLDAKSGKQVWQGAVSSVTVAWTPDGKRVITGGDDGTTSVLNATTGKVLFQDTEVAGIDWVSVSKDSRTAAITDSNNHVHLLDLTNFSTPAIALNDRAVRAVFADSGALYLALPTGTIRAYDLYNADNATIACSIIGGDLSAQEWHELAPHTKMPTLCPQAAATGK